MKPHPRTVLLAFVLFGGPACDGEAAPTASASAPAATVYEPKLSTELVPPALKGLVLGTASDADVVAAFGAGETLKDKAIGGTIEVQYNDKPAVHIELPVKDDVLGGEAWLVPDDGGTPRLHRLELRLRSTGHCAWIETHVGKHEAATRRPGSNRVFGKDGRGFEYTAGTTDGALPVGIGCHPSTRDGVASESLEYSIEGSGGRSMRMNRNP